MASRGKDKEVVMTSIVDRPKEVPDIRQETPKGPSSGLRIAVVILSILVLGLGAWIIYDYTQDTALAPSAEITQLVDEYSAAWNNYDGEAFLATTRAGYTFTSNLAGTFDRDDQQDVIENILPARAWEVEWLDDPIAVGDGPWWYVSIPSRVSTLPNDVMDGISVLTVVDSDGTYLVTQHIFTGR